jgi:hypothetical protein
VQLEVEEGGARIASMPGARAARRGAEQEVPIAGTRSPGVTAIGSSTSEHCPRRQGARASGGRDRPARERARVDQDRAARRPSERAARHHHRLGRVVAGRGKIDES